jgi:hypothetical protein
MNTLDNVGCAPLTVTGVNFTDPPPDVTAKSYNEALDRKAAAQANVMVGTDYTTYFDAPTKAAMLTNRVNELVDGELTRGDVAVEEATRAMANSTTSSRRMAAEASIPRTSNWVVVTNPMAQGTGTDLMWDYNGAGLQRGRDVEVLELVTDDPDRLLFGNQPAVEITYIGGCLDAQTSIVWNTLGAENEEAIYNYGSIADDDSDEDLLWGADPNGADAAMMYDGSFILAGPAALGQDPLFPTAAQFYYGNLYDNWDNSTFLGNPNPANGLCEFDGATDVHMGWRRTGGCPGTPVEILGAWGRAWFVDSNMAYAGTVYEAIGLEITMTEVGAYDPLYGDFALLKWDLTERYGETEDPVYGGTFCDWDVPADYGSNHGLWSDNFNGYALWDHVTPGLAYGFLDPRLVTDYCGVTQGSVPNVIQEIGQRNPGGGGGGYDLWQTDGVDDISLLWTEMVTPSRVSGPHEEPTMLEDHFGLLVCEGLTIGPYETGTVLHAKFAVDASSNDDATIEALAIDVAYRAAIWSGYARGNANMDDCVNLVDVCWILSGNQIYPDDYNGDVDGGGGVGDNDDAMYLLQYVTGLGPAPQGGWRFVF